MPVIVEVALSDGIAVLVAVTAGAITFAVAVLVGVLCAVSLVWVAGGAPASLHEESIVMAMISMEISPGKLIFLLLNEP